MSDLILSIVKKDEGIRLCCDLFRQSAKNVAFSMGFQYPEYDTKMSQYLYRILNIR